MVEYHTYKNVVESYIFACLRSSFVEEMQMVAGIRSVNGNGPSWGDDTRKLLRHVCNFPPHKDEESYQDALSRRPEELMPKETQRTTLCL
ncbi:hypothetical protein CEXT_238141 [Caerostris extrusa]|uniref:Uncharacterized protein n=1 Tax=Caerostris extrusa TaxID=172846 RepID=A0AAV4RLB2_CAEEX|nr:hypothetical protein CEXT_238141 [Caerostris extrusa]